jgi:FdhD protein
MKPGVPGDAATEAIRIAQVHRVTSSAIRPDTDLLARECAVALEFNGVSHAVMLATPLDLSDFALGFALSEGIIDRAEQCYGIEMHEGDEGWTARIEISASCFARLKQFRRNLTGRTGCGLCGVESLAHVFRTLPDLREAGTLLDPASINHALSELASHQAIGAATGATHAAAWADPRGNIRIVREDVGRHNALDKLIGAGLRAKSAGWRDGFLIITSRASMEMVQKCAMAGFGTLIALSAPTDLAVRLAQEHGICLVGFATPGRWTVYSHPQRLAGLPTDHASVNATAQISQRG